MCANFGRQANSLFAPVEAIFFNANEEVEFQTRIAERSANTEVVPVVDAAQLKMRADGRLAESNYRYTMIGFNATCNAIAPGLAAVFYEISGANPRRVADEDVNVPAAVSIYNTAMEIKFNALMGRSLLVTHGENIVDGFLGIEHKFLDNHLFFTLILEELKAKQTTAEFYRAEIVGREVRIFMIDTASRRTDIHADPRHVFASGWYFSNREDTGAAVFAAPCLYTRFGTAVMRRRGSKISHVGADMVGRTTGLISRVASQTIDMAKVKSRVALLLSKNLGFTDNQKEQDAAVQRCISFLGRFGIRRDFAKVIVQNAASVGADIGPKDFSDAYDTRALKGRTMYDILCSVIRYAKSQPSQPKLNFQAAAMELLLPQEKKAENKVGN